MDSPTDDKQSGRYTGHSPQFSVRVTHDTKVAIDTIAEREGRNTSDVLRRVIRLGLERELDNVRSV